MVKLGEMKFSYPQSKAILQKIKNSKNIVINIHQTPDLDSVGSVLSLFWAIRQLGKEPAIISPSLINKKFLSLKGSEKIKVIDFSTFDFSSFDLFVILDASSSNMVTGSPEIALPKISTIIIDHHKTNNLKGEIKLIDNKASAVGEILYQLFLDWKIVITKEMATDLFGSIYSDTVCLKYPRLSKRVFKIIKELIDRGADQAFIIEKFYQDYSFSDLKLLGLFLKKLKIEKKLVWTGVSFEEKERIGGSSTAKELMADNFLQSVKEAELGILFFEEKKGEIRVSFRSKGKIDVSKIAEKFGGGGHQKAAGCTIFGRFEEAVEKIIKTISPIFK